MATDTANRQPAPAVRESYEMSKEMIQEHPLPAALTVFALGFGVGLALGALVGESDWRSRHDASRMENLGRQFLATLSQVAPDALRRHFS